MKKMNFLFCFVCLSIIISSCNSNKRPGKPRVLVFSKTAGYRHASIGPAKLAVMKLGQDNGFLVDTTENAGYFNEDSLNNYTVVIFLSTTGNVLNAAQEAAFERYIQAGGGFVGVHAATDTEYDWGWYARMVGANFLSHPHQQDARLMLVDSSDISTKHLHSPWTRKDEWYNFKKMNPDVHVLLKIDEKSYEGGQNGDNHPMAWYHEYDGGRAFYTALGHTDESWSEDNFLKHLLGGIQYAIGDNKNLDHKKSTSQVPPIEDRFTKTNLVQGEFFEPTEMTVLPNLDILVAQRRGELLLYKKSDNKVTQAGFLNVYWKATVPNVNAEEGFMGIKADPDFANNHFVYLFYSPKDSSVNRLSRFKFENDKLDMNSEKVVLQFHSDRNICCHTGGSIDFGGDGKTLFVSTGDNSTPFDEPNQKFVNRGFAPLDDRPGHSQYDARRTSGNTNDLRGKILRITINPDGSYSIPAGNLFPQGTANTKPEIYVMGNRNPYRIMVDKKTNFLYWGEVGPDANNDSFATRGPRGYDEVNQAREAGFFGWPLFVGDNYAYHEYDYSNGTTKPSFEVAKPVNASRNNTGLQNLPPAKPAFIWYPYAATGDFPQVGTGGRNAMAGPVYYTDMFPAETRLPDYYNKKLFIYEWIRGWIKVVHMRPNGDFDKMEPFMEHTKLANLIDMEVGPDGKLYLLEYGTGWFQKNPDAGLSRIDYNGGNLSPKVANLKVNKTSGTLPLTITATVEATDAEKDSLTYSWNIGGTKKETKEPRLEYTIDKAGDYPVSVDVIDANKGTTKSETVAVYAGNEAPVVSIAVTGNQTFYFPGKPVSYSVKVEDRDDPSQPDPANLVVSADYIEGSDKAAANMGHQVLTEAMMGKNLMLSLDCKTCHKESEKSIGPAYTEIAKKYEKDPKAESYLVDKIIKGGGGVWGEVAMAAHPNLDPDDARQIVHWIQSLTAAKVVAKSLPPTGTVQPTLGKPAKDNGLLYISAAYTDKGGNNIKPLTGHALLALRSNKLNFGLVDSLSGFTAATFGGTRFMVTPTTEGWFVLKKIDLGSISTVALSAGFMAAPKGYTIELHLDAPNGKLLATFDLPAQADKGPNPKPTQLILNSAFEPVTDGKMHNLYVVSRPKDSKEAAQVYLGYIEFR